MLTRRGLLRGLAQIAVLGPLALRRLPKVLEMEIQYTAWVIVYTREELQRWADNGLLPPAPIHGATS